MKKLITIISTALLVLLAAISILDLIITSPPTITKKLDTLVPNELKGWKIKDLPLADTEEMRERVDEILRFDDYISRKYTRLSDGAEFILYIAYWKPKSASVMEVNTHTPDICWVANGWKKLQTEKKPFKFNNIKEGQFRKFSKLGTTNDVVYWHLVGNKVYVNEGVISKRYKMDSLMAPLKLGTKIRGDQIFLRLSTTSKANLKDRALFEELHLIQFLQETNETDTPQNTSS